MPVQDISTVQSKVIGVCCVQGEEHRLLKSMWDLRFSEFTAFFTDISEDDSVIKIVQKINKEVMMTGLPGLAGQSVILAVFLDLTREIKPELLKALAGVPDRLAMALGCMVQINYTFGFMGLKSAEDYDEKAIGGQIRKVVTTEGYNKGLILVAEPTFGGEQENRWKAVMLYLDMLRRGASIGTASGVSHANGTVGFLRYGEFAENQREIFQAREQALKQNLGSEGYTPFGDKLISRLGDLDVKAVELFRVNPALQPIHPDMIVTGMRKKMQAGRGSNEEFNKARLVTVDAAVETGKRLEQQVLDFFKTQIGAPKDYLVSLFQEAGAGIGFVEDRAKVNDKLGQKLQVVPEPSMPMLAYSSDQEAAYRTELGTYFEKKLHYAIYNAKKWVQDALLAAYRDIPDEVFEAERTKMQKELEIVRIKQNHVPDRQNFCDIAIGGGLGMECQFFVFGGDAGDVTLKFIVCREQSDAMFLNGCVVMGPECRFYINANTGSLVDKKSAPIKAVQAALFNCTDDILEQLLA